jgi:DNA-binding HxlR family transcriptional regulator
VSRKSYDQACSVASALDRIGERWSLLIVRELLLGPLRFSDLARGVGGAPTDVLALRLRNLEADGIVRRRELELPAAGTVYELTELGRELEGPVMELGRWGLNFYRLEDLPGLVTSSLANAMRVILRAPERGAPIVLQLYSEGHATWLRVLPEGITAGRGKVDDPDLTLSGDASDVIAAVVQGGEAEERIEIDGDTAALARLREMVDLPDRLREEALAGVAVTS